MNGEINFMHYKWSETKLLAPQQCPPIAMKSSTSTTNREQRTSSRRLYATLSTRSDVDLALRNQHESHNHSIKSYLPSAPFNPSYSSRHFQPSRAILPSTSAKIRIKIIPTYDLGCKELALVPASPTIPIAKPAASPHMPTARPPPSMRKPVYTGNLSFSPWDITTASTNLYEL